MFKQSFKKRIKLIAAVLIVATAFILFSLYNAWSEINMSKVNAWTEHPTADCGVVLTGGPQRIREGFDLLAQKRIGKLIISGVYKEVRLEDLIPRVDYYPELSPEDIILEKSSLTTYGNAQESLSLVEALNCRKVLLITSFVHMPRALKTFKAAFPDHIQIVPRSTVGRGYPADFDETGLEAIKMVFYSFWAY